MESFEKSAGELALFLWALFERDVAVHKLRKDGSQLLTLENASGRFDAQSRFVSHTLLRMDRTTGENDDVC